MREFVCVESRPYDNPGVRLDFRSNLFGFIARKPE